MMKRIPLTLLLCFFDASCTTLPTGPLSTEEALHFQEAYASWPTTAWHAPDPNALPGGPQGEQIRLGIALLTQTSQFMGPHAPNPLQRLAGNNLQCVQCHQAGSSGLPGTKRDVLPLVNAVNDYPKLDPKSMHVITLEERIMGMCGHGQAPAHATSAQVQAILAYLHWLAEGTQPHTHMQGTGLAPLTFPARAANPIAGGQAYAQRCRTCHGALGKGVANMDFASGMGYVVPPIAGDDSFDDTGHMARVPLLTRFIHSAMPPGARPDAPTLSVDEAYDIAAYVTTVLPRSQGDNRRPYPNVRFRPDGVALTDWLGGDAQGLARLRLGPFAHPNEENVR